MQRPIVPSEKRALNKRIVEALADKLYEMELNKEADHKIWAYRKAAWLIEDMQEDIGLVYHTMGLTGLQSIQSIGQGLGSIVAKLIELQADLPKAGPT